MNLITTEQIQSAIQQFLNMSAQKKYKPIEKYLAKAIDSGNTTDIEQHQADIQAIKQKYTLDIWIGDAATRMTQQLQFGTHIAKGVHPDAKGNNVNLINPPDLPDYLLGSQTIKLELDANSSAAALPLAAFFNIQIGNFKLRELIQAEHTALSGCFASSQKQSDQYQQLFQAALQSIICTPTTSELNKQVLWPDDGIHSMENDQYHCLIPLHPSALTHYLFRQINEQRYSEENKQARDNRKKKMAEQKSYVSFPNLAFIKLGGGNSQNVSRLTNQQRGCNFLLPSLPPQIEESRAYTLTKRQTSFFNSGLRYHCYWGLQELFSVVKNKHNTVAVRNKRKNEALDLILSIVLSIAKQIQNTLPAGWSKDYQLDMAQKYWLDPKRAELEGESDFKSKRETMPWIEEIESHFAHWINSILKEQFKVMAGDFNDSEFREWCREMQDAIKASQRQQEGIF